MTTIFPSTEASREAFANYGGIVLRGPTSDDWGTKAAKELKKLGYTGPITGFYSGEKDLAKEMDINGVHLYWNESKDVDLAAFVQFILEAERRSGNPATAYVIGSTQEAVRLGLADDMRFKVHSTLEKACAAAYEAMFPQRKN
jgi:hypothetical protein